MANDGQSASRVWLAALAFTALGIGAAARAESASPRSPQELAQRIDALLAQSWRGDEVVPAAIADDAEFLRRASLDLIGRIPAVSEVIAFLDDRDPDKRAKWVNAKLADPDAVRHFSRVWRALLLSQADAQNAVYLAPKMETWLARQWRENVPYDVWVRKLIAAPLDSSPSSRLDPAQNAQHSGMAFFQANELKPEALAAATSRIFLGVNLDCAECHNHPFADWKREQFWQLAAFFSSVQRLRPDNSFMAAPENTRCRELKISGTEQVVAATFLDGQAPDWQNVSAPRDALAEWLTAPENPYFARAIANRLWAQFFGLGIMEPLDGLGGREPASHPQLLAALAEELIASGYDQKFLIRAILSSQAYQRTSRQSHLSQREAQRFARMAVRGLTPEQVFDSLSQATGFRESEPEARAEFLAKFAYLDRPSETQTSIVQALTLMNGKFVAGMTTVATSEMLAAVADAPFFDTAGRIETLFLATLSRRPTPREAEDMARFVNEHIGNEHEALGDIFWTLLNTSEFIFNH